MGTGAKTVTILFTDLVGSTELLQRAGDEQAQRIFKAHHRLLREAVGAHGGHEVKWLGDGLMVAFDSASDAVRCAIAMQQASRRPTAGERLEIRTGLNVGETLVDESDYFGTPVVVARRLCDKAGSGQILASDIVVRLFDGRSGDITTKDLGPLQLKGIMDPVPGVEIVYSHDPMALLRKLPFVGRRAEYDTLLKKLSEARQRKGSVVLLAGEPGIGKTRLTEEFCEHMSAEATIIRGNCYEGDVAAPFGPWLEALRSLIEQTPDDLLRDALGDGAPDISVTLPELRRRLPDIAEAPDLDPESERARLFDSIATFLRNAAEQRPLVVFLDDLHWADKPSLLLLELITRRVADRGVVILGTYRDMEVDRVHPLAQTLAALRRMEHHERIVLRGFTEESVYELLTILEPSELAEPTRRALAGVLYGGAEGNPLFIREVLNNLVETGKLVQEDGVWVGATASIGDFAIPEGIKEAIGRRLSRLSEGCNQMLGRACTLTGSFTWEELRAISDDPEDELLDYLDEALAAQILAGRDKLTYVFSHALIRATLYDELSGPRRVMLHRRVAEALETLHAGDLDAHLSDLAAHYLAATGNDAQKAVDYSIRAGDQTRELLAWEEAATHYQRALDAMDVAKTVEPEARCRVLLALGHMLFNSGQASAAVNAFRQAAAAARDLGSAELLSEAACSFERAGFMVAGDPLLASQRLELIDEALGALGRQDSAWRARLLGQRTRPALAVAGARDAVRLGGWGSLSGHKDPEILRQAREAVAVARRVGDPAITAMTLDDLFQYLIGPGGQTEKRAICDEWIACAQKAGSPKLEVNAWGSLFIVALSQGDMAAAYEAYEQCIRLAGELRIASATRVNVTRRATLAIAEGRFDEAETAVYESLNIGQANNDATGLIAFGGQIMQLRYYQGRCAELEGMYRGTVEQSPNVEAYQAGLAVILAETGREEEARAMFDLLAARGFASIPEDGLWMSTMTGLTLVCARLSHREGAAALYETFSRHPEGNANAGDAQSYGPVAGYLGQLAAVLQRWDDAERYFQAAIALDGQMGHRPDLARTQVNYARVLLRRNSPGDRDRGAALLQEALSFAEEAGMGQVQVGAERLLST